MTAPKLVALTYSGPGVGPLDFSIVDAEGEPVINVKKGQTVYAPTSLASELVDDHGNSDHWKKATKTAKKAVKKTTRRKA